MRVATTETLTPNGLDWVVARIEKVAVRFRHESGVWADTDRYQPTRDGQLGVQLLAKHRIGVTPIVEGLHAGKWQAPAREYKGGRWHASTILGDTLLEAGMRALVYQTRGATVSLPEAVALFH